MLSNIFTVMGLAATASAHIIMTNPVPYGTPDNSPLEASGSNFPCKGIANPGGSDNTYKAGSTQQLKFEGTAVHGGGSCQVSVTTDLNPTKNSKWKVIQSIEGGCPAKNTPGNLEGSNAAAEDPYSYDFKIPDEMPSGEYVLAWSWFNKVGNREMYMNCASVEVTGGSDDEAFLDTLPDMFVANVGNGCTTPDSKDVEFPHPGNALARFNGASSAFAEPTEAACLSGSGGDAPSSTATSASAAPTSASPSAPASSQATIPGGGFYTVSSSAAVPAPTSSAAVPTSSAAVPTAPAATTSAAVAPAPTSGTGGGSGSHAAGSACTTEGAWDCIDGSSYQRCASGTWSAVMQLAAGTTCKAGESSDMAIAAIKRRALPLRV